MRLGDTLGAGVQVEAIGILIAAGSMGFGTMLFVVVFELECRAGSGVGLQCSCSQCLSPVCGSLEVGEAMLCSVGGWGSSVSCGDA